MVLRRLLSSSNHKLIDYNYHNVILLENQLERMADENFQLQHDAAEEEQSEKKKKRKKQKHSKPSSFSDDSRADESKPDEGDGSSPKRQKTIVEDHVQVG
jgi:hypothetical protein